MSQLQGKTVFITGGSRGIGRAIALKFAQAGANIIIAAKTSEPHPKLDGTIHTVAAEVEALGAKALPLVVDIRDEDMIADAVEKTVATFGGIDILVNNASAIFLAGTLETPMKRYDLMLDVNARGTFATSQACLPALLKSDNPHILTLSPPIDMSAKWFKDHVAYTISKYGMSMCTLGMAQEFREQGVAVNSLWPKTTIATDAISANFPPEIYQASRKPDIMADAALAVVTQDSREHTGNFYIDEEILAQSGITDFNDYAINPDTPLFTDLFLEK